MRELLEAKRIVIKVGTSTLTYPNGRLNLKRIERLAMVISDLRNRGKEVVLVSSGAIGVGAIRLGFDKRPEKIEEKQASAAVGQAALIQIYQSFFIGYNQKVAQVLLTKEDTSEGERRKNIINTFDTLFSLGAIPIVNANDTISTYEIEFSDNDQLSAEVAAITNAKLLIILTDIDALYDKNPKEYFDAKPINVVKRITPEIENMAGDHGSTFSVGGMATKICAAKICMEHNIEMAIINGEDPFSIYRLMEGEPIGTLFTNKE